MDRLGTHLTLSEYCRLRILSTVLFTSFAQVFMQRAGQWSLDAAARRLYSLLGEVHARVFLRTQRFDVVELRSKSDHAQQLDD